MKNPFTYTEIVDKDLFVGRDFILADLIKHIKNTQNVIIYGQRRVGKSSLVQEALSRYQKSLNKKSKHSFINLELSQFSSKEEFIGQFALEINKLIKIAKPLKSKFSEITNLINSLRLSSKLNPITGEVEHYIDFQGSSRQIPDTVNQVFNLLEDISKDYSLTIVFDEFQTIVDWDRNGKFQWLLRSRVQRQKKIGYIFLGSSRKLIHQIFLKSKSAFYRSGILIHIDNFIDPEVFFKWIKSRFIKSKIKITNHTIKRILDITQSHPYYTQKICYHLWNDSESTSREVDIQEVNETIQRLIKFEKNYYIERLNSLSINQRQVIKAIAKLGPNGQIYSKSNIQKYGLPTKTSIKSALKALEESIDPIIYQAENKEIVIEDPLFELWLNSL